MTAPYTVQRCTMQDRLFGPIHSSEDGYTTRCGIEMDEGWYILTNDGTGDVTCKECKEVP